VKWAGSQREDLNGIDFWISNEFGFLARLWGILQRNLEGIWIWGFFLNPSRLLKDLKKIKYTMPWMQPYIN
jgi:hypothetical protein